MLTLGLGLKFLSALWALGWVAWIIRDRERSTLAVLWAVFCLSMAGLLLGESLGGQLPGLQPWLFMVSGGTCSVFWLFTRTLFRARPEIGIFELALVIGIILPSLIKPFIMAGAGLLGLDASLLVSPMVSAQALLSSTALMSCVWEASRSWPEERTEQRLRIAFLSVFCTGVFLCAILIASLEGFPENAAVLIQSTCAVAILAIGSAALIYRQANPLVATRPRPKATSHDNALAERLVRLLDREKLYLNPDLTIAQLAGALNETPNRVSRAITASLKAANINQLVNARRIEHAKGLLNDADSDQMTILQVALESGFNSIGPFNRAFKSQTDTTPREYRRSRNDTPNGAPAE